MLDYHTRTSAVIVCSSAPNFYHFNLSSSLHCFIVEHPSKYYVSVHVPHSRMRYALDRSTCARARKGNSTVFEEGAYLGNGRRQAAQGESKQVSYKLRGLDSSLTYRRTPIAAKRPDTPRNYGLYGGGVASCTYAGSHVRDGGGVVAIMHADLVLVAVLALPNIYLFVCGPEWVST